MERIVCSTCRINISIDGAAFSDHTEEWYCFKCWDKKFTLCNECGKEVSKKNLQYDRELNVICNDCVLKNAPWGESFSVKGMI